MVRDAKNLETFEMCPLVAELKLKTSQVEHFFYVFSCILKAVHILCVYGIGHYLWVGGAGANTEIARTQNLPPPLESRALKFRPPP